MPEISSFDFARLVALKQYSDLEYQLCMLLQITLKIEAKAAATIFHRITNTRARYAIISDLLKLDDRLEFKQHWGKIEKWLSPCDASRNNIVHWEPGKVFVVTIKNSETTTVHDEPHLQNPAKRFQSSAYANAISESDIWVSRDKMRVMMHIVNRLWLSFDDPEQWPWLEIFQQPNMHQNPEGFLSSLNDKGCPAQLPPYPKTDLVWEQSDMSNRSSQIPAN
jgi:hypothetical protein